MPLAFTHTSRPLRLINTLHTDGYGITSGGQYIADPYQNGGSFATAFPASRLAYILSTGYDGFRWCMDPATFFTAASDAILDSRIALVMGHLETHVAAGLKVIANFHVIGSSPVPGWGNVQVTDGIGQPKFERLVYCAQRFATQLHARRATTLPPGSVAFEPFNEPPFNINWPPMMVSLYQRVRAVLPEHTIVVSGRDYGSVTGLIGGFVGSTYGLNPADFGNDANIIYTWHGYEPYAVSNQGNQSNIDIHRLTFPPAAHPGGKAQAIAEFTAAATAAGRQSTIPEFTSQGNAHGIDFYFDHPTYLATEVTRLATWATSKGVALKQLWCGEFGCGGDFGSVSASITTRAAFHNAKIAAVESAGMGGWAVHELYGTQSGFGLASGTSPFPFVPELIPTVLGATMPKTITLANAAFSNVGGGQFTVRTQLVDASNAVVAQGVTAAITVPADPAPVPVATTPTATVS